MDDVRLVLARQHHQEAGEAESLARLHREQRDRLIRQVRAEDPARWSFGQIARRVGCSRELVATICRNLAAR